ncbi:MAG: hypothetical protein ABJD02_09920 [Paraglaciecola sp.]|uniref:hypothetical protein n=1 Tax=Paraglaciecola sp. TaxID=1920173 RepID=UPI0032638B1B
MNYFKLLLLTSSLILTFNAYAYTIDDVEPEAPISLIPVSIGGITFFVFKQSEYLPNEGDDDNSIAGIDSDNDGIRDDVEVKVVLDKPFDRLQRSYLYNLAFYSRKMLSLSAPPERDSRHSPTSIKQLKVIKQIQQVKHCIDSDDPFLSNEIIASHLDSQQRFEAYLDFSEQIQRIGLVNEDPQCFLSESDSFELEGDGFCYNSCIANRSGLIDKSTSVNKSMSVGLGEGVTIRASIQNLFKSHGNITVRIWQDNGSDSGSVELTPGQTFEYLIDHDYDWGSKSGYLRYEVEYVSGDRNWFKVEFQPDVQ